MIENGTKITNFFTSGEWIVVDRKLVDENNCVANPTVQEKYNKEGTFWAVELANEKYYHHHLVPEGIIIEHLEQQKNN